MIRKIALLDYWKCRPEDCVDGVCAAGVCAAAMACPSGLLKQEQPYTVPLPGPSACRACGKCVRACPQKAIKLVSA